MIIPETLKNAHKVRTKEIILIKTKLLFSDLIIFEIKKNRKSEIFNSPNLKP